MSTEKSTIEAQRWLRTADDDLDSAIILKANRKFAHSCFHAQQAAEKALKAVWYHSDADPWGHSIKRLIDDLKSIDMRLFEIFNNFSRQGILLDRFYIPTRYPNGLPDITPDIAFNEEDADICIANAEMIIGAVHNLLQNGHRIPEPSDRSPSTGARQKEQPPAVGNPGADSAEAPTPPYGKPEK